MPQSNQKALRSLIRLEAQTLDELRQAVVDEASRVASILDEDRAKVVATLQRIAEQLQDELTTIILDARHSSEDLAYKQVVIQAHALEIDEPDEPEEDPENHARAMAAAAAFAAAFLMAALASSIQKKRDVKRVIALQDYRLRRIAATEIAQAYGQASLRAYASISNTAIWKRWDATLDARVCKICRDHHGEEVPLDKEFSQGHEPGNVHVNCRCIPSLIKKPA